MKEQKAEDLQCPVCGYYCLGRGGHGCIDKPTIFELEQKQKPMPQEFSKSVDKHFWELC